MSKYKNDAKTVRDEPERTFPSEGTRDIEGNSFSQHGNDDDDCSDTALTCRGKATVLSSSSHGYLSRSVRRSYCPDGSDYLHLKERRSVCKQHCSQGVYSRQPFKRSQSESDPK